MPKYTSCFREVVKYYLAYFFPLRGGLPPIPLICFGKKIAFKGAGVLHPNSAKKNPQKQVFLVKNIILALFDLLLAFFWSI